MECLIFEADPPFPFGHFCIRLQLKTQLKLNKTKIISFRYLLYRTGERIYILTLYLRFPHVNDFLHGSKQDYCPWFRHQGVSWWLHIPQPWPQKSLLPFLLAPCLHRDNDSCFWWHLGECHLKTVASGTFRGEEGEGFRNRGNIGINYPLEVQLCSFTLLELLDVLEQWAIWSLASVERKEEIMSSRISRV